MLSILLMVFLILIVQYSILSTLYSFDINVWLEVSHVNTLLNFSRKKPAYLVCLMSSAPSLGGKVTRRGIVCAVESPDL